MLLDDCLQFVSVEDYTILENLSILERESYGTAVYKTKLKYKFNIKILNDIRY